MADYFVSNSGSNTSPYDTWAKASTSLQSALTLATSTGDRVIIQYNAVPTTDAALSSDTAYTIAAAIGIISASADDSSTAFTPTPMGAGLGANTFIGHSTLNRSISFSGAYGYYIYGLTLLISGSSGDNISTNTLSNSCLFDSCNFIFTNTSTSSMFICGASASSTEFETRIYNCNISFGNSVQGIWSNGKVEIINLTIDSGGTAPSQLFRTNTSSSKSWTTLIGCDLSYVTGTLCTDMSNGNKIFTFKQCKLGSGVTVMSSQAEEAGCEVFVLDCNSGDAHYSFGHYTTTGTLVSDAGVYANDGAEYNSSGSKHSWRLDTSSICSYRMPYRSPWISAYNETTSALTPYFEAASATSGLDESEIWSEWLVKTTGTSPIATFNQTDRGGVKASTTNQASGAASWTGITPTSYKLAPSSSITPADIGDISGRFCCSLTSATFYLDPQIRGLS